MVVCQMCGDVGWPATLIFCSNCRSIAEHTYCLDKSTTTDDGEIRWACEFCEPRVIELSDSTDQSSEAEPPKSLKEFQEVEATEQPRSLLKSQETSAVIEGDFVDDVQWPDSMGPCSTSPLRIIEDDFADDVQWPGTVGPCSTSPLSSSPLPIPTWRGRFCIYGKYSCTVLAHMSIEASFKESETARSLPKLLELEMVPKINIWPMKFRNTVPRADNVNVYFFPEDYRTERVYDRLVDDIIEHEYAMISRVHEVELLVFSSRELHLENWRFQGKYYLWGIFRRKKKSSPQDHSDNHMSSQHGSISCPSPSSSTSEIGEMNTEDGSSLSESGE